MLHLQRRATPHAVNSHASARAEVPHKALGRGDALHSPRVIACELTTFRLQNSFAPRAHPNRVPVLPVCSLARKNQNVFIKKLKKLKSM